MDGKIAGMYDLEETLGSGHFAVVKLARHVFTGEQVAVKVIDKTKLDKVAQDHLYQEVRCMKLVQHPNIIRLYQVIDTQTKLYLILELGENGDLYEYIAKHNGGVGEDESRDIFRQIVEAIAYCHRHHVVHRDLKPENVVFCQNAARVKLTDFGLSNKFLPGEKLKTSCGSLSYAAPEILLGDQYDAPAVDVWSLGVILYMLLVGQKPFVGGTDSETLTMIMDCKFDMPSKLTPESIDLVHKLLVSEPRQRVSLEAILQHPWMKMNENGRISQPLLTNIRERVTKDIHEKITQKMVEGDVADRDAIENSLDCNSYDHIAATYYLLAEAHIREARNAAAEPLSVDQERLHKRRKHVRNSSTPDKKLSTKETTAKISPLVYSGSQNEEPLLFSSSHHAKTRVLVNSTEEPHGRNEHLQAMPARRPGVAESGVLRPRRFSAGATQLSKRAGFRMFQNPLGKDLTGGAGSLQSGSGTLSFSIPMGIRNSSLASVSALGENSKQPNSQDHAKALKEETDSFPALVTNQLLNLIEEADSGEEKEQESLSQTFPPRLCSRTEIRNQRSPLLQRHAMTQGSPTSNLSTTLDPSTSLAADVAGMATPPSGSSPVLRTSGTPTSGMYPNWLTSGMQVSRLGSSSSKSPPQSGSPLSEGSLCQESLQSLQAVKVLPSLDSQRPPQGVKASPIADSSQLLPAVTALLSRRGSPLLPPMKVSSLESDPTKFQTVNSSSPQDSPQPSQATSSSSPDSSPKPSRVVRLLPLIPQTRPDDPSSSNTPTSLKESQPVSTTPLGTLEAVLADIVPSDRSDNIDDFEAQSGVPFRKTVIERHKSMPPNFDVLSPPLSPPATELLVMSEPELDVKFDGLSTPLESSDSSSDTSPRSLKRTHNHTPNDTRSTVSTAQNKAQPTVGTGLSEEMISTAGTCDGQRHLASPFGDDEKEESECADLHESSEDSVDCGGTESTSLLRPGDQVRSDRAIIHSHARFADNSLCSSSRCCTIS